MTHVSVLSSKSSCSSRRTPRVRSESAAVTDGLATLYCAPSELADASDFDKRLLSVRCEISFECTHPIGAWAKFLPETRRKAVTDLRRLNFALIRRIVVRCTKFTRISLRITIVATVLRHHSCLRFSQALNTQSEHNLNTANSSSSAK